jgi:hypothetical protein
MPQLGVQCHRSRGGIGVTVLQLLHIEAIEVALFGR